MLSRVTNNFVEVTAVTGQQALPTAGSSWHVAAAFSGSSVHPSKL